MAVAESEAQGRGNFSEACIGVCEDGSPDVGGMIEAKDEREISSIRARASVFVSLRGYKKVLGEWNIVCCALNLKRMNTLMVWE